MAFRLLQGGRRIAGNCDAPFATEGVEREDCRRGNELLVPFGGEGEL